MRKCCPLHILDPLIRSIGDGEGGEEVLGPCGPLNSQPDG